MGTNLIQIPVLNCLLPIQHHYHSYLSLGNSLPRTPSSLCFQVRVYQCEKFRWEIGWNEAKAAVLWKQLTYKRDVNRWDSHRGFWGNSQYPLQNKIISRPFYRLLKHVTASDKLLRKIFTSVFQAEIFCVNFLTPGQQQ